jgi:hypothetical protein
MTTVADIFERLAQQPETEQPAEPEIIRRGPQPIIPPAHRKASPNEQLLTWMVNHWSKPTVTLRDISAYGPNCVRDPADIMSLTKTLVQYGWLIPVRAWRRDMKKWRIVREPGQKISAQTATQP